MPPKGPQTTLWHYKDAATGKVEGPYSPAEITQLQQMGKLESDAMLFADAKHPQAALSLSDLQSMWGSTVDAARRASAEDPELEALAQMPVEEPKADGGGGDDDRKRGSGLKPPAALSKAKSNVSEKLNAVAGKIDQKISPLVKQATTGLGDLSKGTENLVGSAGGAAGALGAKAASAASGATAAINKATDEIAAATEAQAKAVQDIKLRKAEEPKDTMETTAPDLAKVMSAEL